MTQEEKIMTARKMLDELTKVIGDKESCEFLAKYAIIRRQFTGMLAFVDQLLFEAQTP